MIHLLAARRLVATNARKSRKRGLKPGMDVLEERKVLSTVTGGSTTGSFEGMPWSYVYSQATQTGTLTITDQAGSDKVTITAAHPDLSPGDPGYNPANVNEITGINLNDNDQTGGPSIVPGTSISVVVNNTGPGKDTFVNDEPTFNLTLNPAAPTTPTTPPTTPPTTGPTSTVQTGTGAGMQWKAYYDSAIGEYRLDINDVAGRGDSVMLMNSGGQLEFDDMGGTVSNGPKFASNAHVDVRVFTDNAPGSIFGAEKNVVAIGSGPGALMNKFETHAQTMTGGISTPTGTITVDYAYNCITDTGVMTIHNISNGGKPETFDYAGQTLNQSPGDPTPDSPTSNPMQSIQFQSTTNSDDNGGVNVFVPGQADATITVQVDNSGLKAGQTGYTFKQTGSL